MMRHPRESVQQVGRLKNGCFPISNDKKQSLQFLRGGIVLKGKTKTTGSSNANKPSRLLILLNINFGFSSNSPTTIKLIKSGRLFCCLISKLLGVLVGFGIWNYMQTHIYRKGTKNLSVEFGKFLQKYLYFCKSTMITSNHKKTGIFLSGWLDFQC